MTVGIRGTLLYVAQSAPGAPAGPAELPQTVIGVLEGTGEISFTDTSGSRRVSHSKEFRDLEQRHPDYERAQAFIRKNAKRL